MLSDKKYSYIKIIKKEKKMKIKEIIRKNK